MSTQNIVLFVAQRSFLHPELGEEIRWRQGVGHEGKYFVDHGVALVGPFESWDEAEAHLRVAAVNANITFTRGEEWKAGVR